MAIGDTLYTRLSPSINLLDQNGEPIDVSTDGVLVEFTEVTQEDSGIPSVGVPVAGA